MPQPNRVADAIRKHLQRADGSDPYHDMTDDELTARWNAKNPPNAPEASSDQHPALHAFERSVGQDKGKMDALGGLVGGAVGFPGVGVAAGDALANLAGKAGGDNKDQSAMDMLEEAAMKGGLTAIGGKAIGAASSLVKAAPPIADLATPTSKAGLIKTMVMGGARGLGNILRSIEGVANTPLTGGADAVGDTPMDFSVGAPNPRQPSWMGKSTEKPYRANGGPNDNDWFDSSSLHPPKPANPADSSISPVGRARGTDPGAFSNTLGVRNVTASTDSPAGQLMRETPPDLSRNARPGDNGAIDALLKSAGLPTNVPGDFSSSGAADELGAPPAVGGTALPGQAGETSPALLKFLQAELPGDASLPGDALAGQAPHTETISRYPLPSDEGTTVAPSSGVKSAAGEPSDQSYTAFAKQMDDIINQTTPDELAREAGSGPQRRITRKGYPGYTNTFEAAP